MQQYELLSNVIIFNDQINIIQALAISLTQSTLTIKFNTLKKHSC